MAANIYFNYLLQTFTSIICLQTFTFIIGCIHFTCLLIYKNYLLGSLHFYHLWIGFQRNDHIFGAKFVKKLRIYKCFRPSPPFPLTLTYHFFKKELFPKRKKRSYEKHCAIFWELTKIVFFFAQKFYATKKYYKFFFRKIAQKFCEWKP